MTEVLYYTLIESQWMICIVLGIGKHLSDALPVHNMCNEWDALWPPPFSFVLEYDIRKVQEHQGLELDELN